jgi:hypothetical protein
MLVNTKSEPCTKETARENALLEIVQGLNSPELTVKDVKFKTKPIRIRYAAETVTVTKLRKLAQAYTTFLILFVFVIIVLYSLIKQPQIIRIHKRTSSGAAILK